MIFQYFLTGKFCGSKAVLSIDITTDFFSFFHGKSSLIYNFLHFAHAQPHCKKVAESRQARACFLTLVTIYKFVNSLHRCQYGSLWNLPVSGVCTIWNPSILQYALCHLQKLTNIDIS